jgi:nitrite transporter NirC
MYQETIEKCAAVAARIKSTSANNPLSFWIGSLMAGAYVGLGIILIFTLGNLVDPAIRPLVMGATFGIALTLVIIAGAELYTGHTMFLTFGVKTGKLNSTQAVGILAQSWTGNLLGSIVVAYLFYLGGGGQIARHTNQLHRMPLANNTSAGAVVFASATLCTRLPSIGRI